MILWLKLLVILSSIMFLFWFILYIMPAEENVQEKEDFAEYEKLSDAELNERLKDVQKRFALENLKNAEKIIKKLDNLYK